MNLKNKILINRGLGEKGEEIKKYRLVVTK